MLWEIAGADEFREWFDSLSGAEQSSVVAKVDVLAERGPALGRPDVDAVKGSKYPNMKELRIQHAGNPYRVLFAFDPRRTGILLIGGRKSGKRFYAEMVPKADAIYTQYLKKEGLD